MNASGYEWWIFFGIGIKEYALLELVEEFSHALEKSTKLSMV